MKYWKRRNRLSLGIGQVAQRHDKLQLIVTTMETKRHTKKLCVHAEAAAARNQQVGHLGTLQGLQAKQDVKVPRK